MNGLLVRVGADRSGGGGSWNGPVDSASRRFAYVAIPESSPVHPGLEKPYLALAPTLVEFDAELPPHLRARHMHLDPDFEYLTYGDQGERAKQLQRNLGAGDLVVFYAGLADRSASRLVYGLIGLLVVEQILRAVDVPHKDRDLNAHSRRILRRDAHDLIVCGRKCMSGRFDRCLPIGEFRDRAYRVRTDILEEWGGLSVKDGYLQRSARLPRFLDPPRFLRWLDGQEVRLMAANN
jgi:Nucleotide modification associated domain 3